MAYPLLANPHKHFYTTRYQTLAFVNHITAGIDDFDGNDGSAEATIKYGQGNTRAASWHGIVDSDTAVACLPDDYTAFHVKGYNSKTMGLEIGARSPNWDAKPARWVDATLRNAAAYWAPRVIKYAMPIRYVTSKAEVDRLIARGEKVGFTDHWILDPGRRQDPGLHNGRNTFPREKFLQYVREEVARLGGKTPTSPEEDEVPKAIEFSSRGVDGKDHLYVAFPNAREYDYIEDVAEKNDYANVLRRQGFEYEIWKNNAGSSNVGNPDVFGRYIGPDHVKPAGAKREN